MKFEITYSDPRTSARAGVITTDHGEVKTPIFMPVGTVGSVKGVHQKELHDDINAKIILGNTYHLYLRPGMDVIKAAGGLHKFIGWDRNILTDSGGFQVFSLAENRKITREGVTFRSHIDGSKHIFTPENVVDTERIIGSDFMMALDECTPYPCTYEYAKKSLKITHSWLERGVKHFLETEPLYGHSQAYLPIVQGSVYKDLREESAEFIASQNMQANAIGGLSVGEPVEMMYEMIEVVNNILPKDKPRYLMGVGTPANIIEGVARGIDMFDCVMPTRNGRNGMLFTKKGTINIKNEKWKYDFSELDPDGTSFVDHEYSRAYLRHLVISGERLAAQIASIHNLAFYLELVREIRERILDGTFADWKDGAVKQMMERL
ncbi:MAG: tRNA guanosine(34) transglycosylase Tgt [Bacteroidales bacterium]|nr:tRNA guanosine(34) transglycosylase Tgt [Bacteroidales bacterium]MCR4561116.1 tRNA guanosine(34) transglycosylase Tgt [Bacteroidales bacterium]